MQAHVEYGRLLNMIRTALIGLVALLAAPALAQGIPNLPRFDALEQQKQDLEQQHLDSQAAKQQRKLDAMAQPNSGVTQAERGIKKLEYEAQRDKLILRGELERQQIARERQLDAVALPNRRIPAYSTLVVSDPGAYLLPPPPKGQYYARIDGRFVLVDAGSELVVQVLDPLPTDPQFDQPAGPRPPLQPALPVRRIAANSTLVIHDFRSFSLPPPPIGQYYAQVDGRFVLVEAKTERAVKAVQPD
jgi:Ni/Co efflux regulator RcnB